MPKARRVELFAVVVIIVCGMLRRQMMFSHTKFLILGVVIVRRGFASTHLVK